MNNKIIELHQRAHSDPQSITKKEWDIIFKDAFGAPEKDFSEDTKGPSDTKPKKKNWW